MQERLPKVDRGHPAQSNGPEFFPADDRVAIAQRHLRRERDDGLSLWLTGSLVAAQRGLECRADDIPRQVHDGVLQVGVDLHRREAGMMVVA